MDTPIRYGTGREFCDSTSVQPYPLAKILLLNLSKFLNGRFRSFPTRIHDMIIQYLIVDIIIYLLTVVTVLRVFFSIIN